MNFPQNLKYSKEHTWLLAEAGTGTIGITEFAQSELGEIVYADLPNVGKTFKEGEVFGSVEAIKTVNDLFMPVSGEVTAINVLLKDRPTLVNDEPFADGWMIKVKITNTEELENLLSADDYIRVTGS